MIIITGAAGFIGSVIAQDLYRQGAKDLILVDKFTKPDKWKNTLGINFKDFIDRDIFLEKLENNEFGKPQAVIHMGACTDTTEFDMDRLMVQNYEYSRRICSWCLDKDVRFIYASSAAVYGDGSKGFMDSNDHTLGLEPLNPYGFSKLIFDRWLINNGLSNAVAGLRFFNVFGPNEYHKGKMSSIIYRSFPMAKKEGVVKLFKSYKKDYVDGGQTRDFIYVKDIIPVVSFLLEHKNACGIFNLGTGKARTFNELATAILSSLGKEKRIEYIEMPEEIKNKYQYFTQAEMNELRNAGYKKDFMSLEDSVSDYVQNYLLSGRYY